MTGQIETSFIQDEERLREVLDLCYGILGQHLRQMAPYRYEDWLRRLKGEERRLLVYAHQGGKVLSAVLARRESKESLIIGFAACVEEYRGRGITKQLMEILEVEARAQGFQYITLGSQADRFYESCGYHKISEIDGQNIYQKLL